MTKAFECDACPVRFGLKHHLKRHARVHTKPTCPVPGCGKVCQSDSHLERHHRVEHLGLKEWACPQCPKAYAKRADLRAHGARVHGEGDDAGAEAAGGSGSDSGPQQPQAGATEAAAPLPRNTRYACGYQGCEGAFARYAELQAHIHQAHPIVCGECGRQFTRRDVLADHLKTHEPHRDAAWRCPECPRRYLAKKNLSAHVKANHVAVKPFVCLICGSAFGYKHVLERHVELLHAKVQAPATIAGVDAETPSTAAGVDVPAAGGPSTCTLGSRAPLPTPPATPVPLPPAPPASAPTVSSTRTDFSVPLPETGLSASAPSNETLPAFAGIAYPTPVPGQDGGGDDSSSGCGRSHGSKSSTSGDSSNPSSSPFVLHIAMEQGRVPPTRKTRSDCLRLDPEAAASLLDSLTGTSYATKRPIACIVEGCPIRFARAYDLKRHLAACHPGHVAP